MADGRPSWRQEPERGNITGLKLMRWLALNAPDWVTSPLLAAIALYFTMFSTRTARAAAEVYFCRLTGRSAGFADRFRQTLTYAHVILDRVRLLSEGVAAYHVTSSSAEIVERHHRSQSGGILLGAHFGSFEALRAFDRTLPGLSVRYLMHQENAGKIAALLDTLNPEVAAMVIPLTDGQSAMLAAREAIAEGSFVAFLGDRMTGPAERAAVEVDFLGAPMSVPRAPYQIAMLAGAPLVLCFAPRTGKRQYELTFIELHDGSPVARDSRDRVCRELAQAYAATLARMCRAHPHNWFNFFDVWR